MKPILPTPALVYSLALTLTAALPVGARADSENSDAFAAAARAKADAADQFSVLGAEPGWFFLKSELSQAGLGKFWEKPWDQVVQNPGKENPIPYMVEFQEALAAKGVELLIVPIPMKASIYPEKFDANFGPGDPYALKPLYDLMRAEGLDVFDIEPVFAALRATGKLYCEQDAHFSPRACEILAASLAKKIKAKDWGADLAPEAIVRGDATEIKITGDQAAGTDFGKPVGAEPLSVKFAGKDGGARPSAVEPDSESPILLMGDSHTLVFQAGSSNRMHCSGAGLLDHLQFELQSRIAHHGQMGSGMVQARRTLYGKVRAAPGYWDSKKLVIWVFSCREFTQSADKLLSIPIEPK